MQISIYIRRAKVKRSRKPGRSENLILAQKVEARHKFLRHDFSVYFKHIAQSCLYLSVNL